MAVEAVRAALHDAELELDDIDGLVTYTADSHEPSDLAGELNLSELTYWAELPFGGGGSCAAIDDAARAVSARLAKTVVVYRSLNGRSGKRYGAGAANLERANHSFTMPFGLVTPAHSLALNVSRYMYEWNLSAAAWAPVVLAAHRHAATNPAARFYQQPITIEDYESSPWVVEPILRVLDCCLESDGAVAIVVSTRDRAKGLAHDAVRIVASARSLTAQTAGLTRDYHRPSIATLPETESVGRQLWEMSGLRPSDIQAAMLYDHFAPYVIRQIEALGFCEVGHGSEFVRDGAIEIGGRLPVNPHGGNLAEGYVHGLNAVAEGVRQICGTAANQVPGIEHVLVTGGPIGATSGLILCHG